MKLPRTLHIEGSRLPLGKIDPDAIPFEVLKEQYLVIEEKVDGTGVSISLNSNLDLEINHRGSPATGKEFRGLHDWANSYQEELYSLLGERYVMFGEWMLHKHTVFYDNLPHFFLESDIYDQEKQVWLSTNVRYDMLKYHEYIYHVPMIAAFKPSTLEQLTTLVGKTRYQSDNWLQALTNKCQMLGLNLEKVLLETECSGLMEGLYIKHEDEHQVINRYKYVRFEFLQSILNSGTHLMDRIPITNDVSV
jgi:RNA ligase